MGGNSITANFFAAFAGAFMYFATLTEVPIVQGLTGSGLLYGTLVSGSIGHTVLPGRAQPIYRVL